MRALLKYLAAVLAAIMIVSSPARASEASETFVEQNANQALEVLNDPDLDTEARTETFSEFMDKFADLEAVSRFVIGRYVRKFDDAQMARYTEAFRAYALSVYQAELDRYRGNELEVTGSFDRSERDSIVNSVIRRPDGEDFDIRWRVLKREEGFQVVDVALNQDGNLLWLAIEQRAQFTDLLDRTNGSFDALMERIADMTEELEAKSRGSETL